MNAIRFGLGRWSLGAGIAVAALGMASATAQEITEFRIGILGGENEADRLRSNACLAERFEALLGVPVSLFPAADYAGVLEGLLGGTLDYAELGASGYAGIYLEDPDAVLPILTTRQVDGSTGYYSIMLARSDSGITSFEDMQGRVLGFADPNSTSGYLVPMVSFLNAGIDPEEYFADTRFSGGHEQNVLAVVNGEIDGGVTWVSGVGDFEEGYTSGALRRMIDSGLLDMSELTQVWQSPLIPNGPIVVRSELPEEVRSAVLDSLLAMPEDDPECFYSAMSGEFDSYVEVDETFYETIIAARRMVIEGDS